MIKLIALIVANLKEFMRNWKSVLMLTVFPILLISTIFLSFNPTGLRTISAGLVQDGYDITEVQDTFFSYIDFYEYPSLELCMQELKKSNLYLCLNIKNEGVIILEVYYDNTREPVIWEIIERIKSTVDLIQKEKSKQIAGDFLTDFKLTLNRVEDFNQELNSTSLEIDKYIEEIDDTLDGQEYVRDDLTNSIDLMDEDINQADLLKSNFYSKKSSFMINSRNALVKIRSYSRSMRNLSSYDRRLVNDIIDESYYAEEEIEDYEEEVDNYYQEAGNKLDEYRSASYKGKSYLNEFDKGNEKLEDTKSDLQIYKIKLNNCSYEINDIQKKFNDIKNLNAETIVNPITLFNIPSYQPKTENIEKIENENIASAIITGLNLISLQTLFPTILILITLFLSLLISSFISLQNINSPATKRLRLVKGIFLSQLFSNYFSSLIILMITLICILITGNFLFQLKIIENLGIIMLTLFIMVTNFILIGMAFAHLIKKESITLLITTFILVLAMFLSGFLLPIERMSPAAAAISSKMPSTLTLEAFKKIVFYEQNIYTMQHFFMISGIWLIITFALLIIIKRVRKS